MFCSKLFVLVLLFHLTRMTKPLSTAKRTHLQEYQERVLACYRFYQDPQRVLFGGFWLHKTDLEKHFFRGAGRKQPTRGVLAQNQTPSSIRGKQNPPSDRAPPARPPAKALLLFANLLHRRPKLLLLELGRNLISPSIWNWDQKNKPQKGRKGTLKWEVFMIIWKLQEDFTNGNAWLSRECSCGGLVRLFDCFNLQKADQVLHLLLPSTKKQICNLTTCTAGLWCLNEPFAFCWRNKLTSH